MSLFNFGKKKKKKYGKIYTKEKYELLLKTGMFFEFHPELTGRWENDKKIIRPPKKKQIPKE